MYTYTGYRYAWRNPLALFFPLLPFLLPFHLLGNLLAVMGSCPLWSQVADKLIFPVPSPCSYTPHSRWIPTPWGCPELNIHLSELAYTRPSMVGNNYDLEFAVRPDGSTTELKLGTLVLARTTLAGSMRWGGGTLNWEPLASWKPYRSNIKLGIARIEVNSGPGIF